MKFINFKKISFLFTALLFISLINACEDAIPTDYIEQKFVEAYLIVDEPIRNIIVMNTQPVNQKFDYAHSLIRDANVKIIGDGREFILSIDTAGELGYYYPDTTYLVKPNTLYKIEIRIPGYTELITAETNTPSRFKYIKTSDYYLQYPKDTVNLPPLDTFKLEWEKVPGITFFILNLKCLDTIEYGKYLIPQTDEKNRRIERPWNEDWMFKEQSNTAPIPNTKTPVVWMSFKWFGLHDVSVFAPDSNYLKWFLQNTIKNQYDPLLGSVKNAIGVFGSCSAARDTFFLKKNQP
ncbi:MAG: DUF4249 family protein [Bacteroidetes bacterium]|nr:MAG: DUF4249 family protein [Bacteroidota bacterium]